MSADPRLNGKVDVVAPPTPCEARTVLFRFE